MVFLFDVSCIIVRLVVAATLIPMCIDEWKYLCRK